MHGLTGQRPPYSAQETCTEVLHGEPIDDPYRWLEHQSAPRTREWLQRQERYTRDYFDAIPGRHRVRQRIAELLDVESLECPWQATNRYFFLKREVHQEQPCIYLREDPDGEDQLLVDPASRGQGPHTTVRIHCVSADGRLLAYEVRNGGERTCEIEFFNLDERRTVRDRLPCGIARGIVIAPDNKSFYYVHDTGAQDRGCGVFHHCFGSAPDEDREIFHADSTSCTKLLVSGDSARLCFVVFRSRPRLSADYFLWSLTQQGQARCVRQETSHQFELRVSDGRVLALTAAGSPNRKIIELMDPEAQESCWKDILSESGMQIVAFRARRGRLLVNYATGTSQRVALYDRAGKKLGEMGLPEDGTARVHLRGWDGTDVFYSYESFTRPPSIARWVPETGSHISWAIRKLLRPITGMTTRRTYYSSNDGTRVPIYLVGKNDILDSGPRPLILTGYGGFGVSMTPRFGVFTTLMMEQGCIFALTNLRGGSEFGPAWHEAAKGQNRQRAFDDFISAAKWLIEQRYTTSERLGIFGGSNSGLLVGAALTQRPDLFRVALCIAPLLDMLRFHLFGTAYRWIEEYGSPENPEDFRALWKYSPYHRVQDGLAYPSVLLVSGDADMRCDPMHARKMTARLQAATRSGNPVLLDYKPTRGHVPVLPLSERIDALSDRILFMCQQLGIEL